jgi:serine/threonine protein kinase
MSLASLSPPSPAPPRAPRGRPGDLVAGRYLLETLLGAGGMGAVWAARDHRRDQPVALKELTSVRAAAYDGTDGTDDGGEAGRLMREACGEAAAARRVRHPGVIRVYDVVGPDRAPWIVMERVPGYSLAREIRRRGPLPAALVGDVAGQLLAAVTAVHAAGLVHRDVSPGNVLLTSTGRVVLADFGLAASREECAGPEVSRFLGSPPYVAPETVRDGRAGPAADLFAVGATLFAAVEGRRPFDAGSPRATLRALLNEPVPAMRYAGGLEPVLRGLLCKDPGHRLTARQAADQLAAHPAAA